MIKRAAKAALQSNFRYRLGAVLVQHGAVVSTGFNRVGHRARHIDDPVKQSSVHAEADAILKLLKRNKLDALAGAKLYVTRIRTDGSLALSKPCSSCMSLIRSVGIREIIYTTDSQSIERIKL